MNSNGCVQAWIDIKCVEKSLKPFMNSESDKYMREAVRPLLELEKEKDVLLVQVGVLFLGWKGGLMQCSVASIQYKGS